MEVFDPRQAHIEMLTNGRWAIFNPDGSRFELSVTYATRAAARRAHAGLRASAARAAKIEKEALRVINVAAENKFY